MPAGIGALADSPSTVHHRSKDILGRVYEYFIGQFANAEGKKGGPFYTPQSVVRLLVEMLAPYKSRIYDPCCRIKLHVQLHLHHERTRPA